MVSVIGCRAKSQLPLILVFFYCLSIHLEPLRLTTWQKKRKLNSRKNCTLLADGIWLSGSDRNVNLQTHFLGQRSGCIPSCDSGGLNPSRVKGPYMVISIGVLLPIILLEQTQHGLSSGCWSHEELRVALSWFPSGDSGEVASLHYGKLSSSWLNVKTEINVVGILWLPSSFFEYTFGGENWVKNAYGDSFDSH